MNAHHVKTVPGRKTDVNDCQWLQQLHTYGLLSGSFRPEDQICVLRSYIRQRDSLIKSATTHVQRMPKALIQMNLQLHKVISDITGLTGMKIIKAILSEVGLDPERFPTVKHFTSWLGLCPGQKITGGKVKSSQTRQVVNRAANAFRIAAFSLTRSRSALGAFYRRLRSRLGAPKAITATAHKLARIFYRMWTTPGQYSDPGMDYYEQKYQELMLKNLQNKADALGLQLVPKSEEHSDHSYSPNLAT